MWFAPKSKGFFIDYTEHSVLIARTSAMEAPLVVEELREVPTSDTIAMADVLKQLQPKRGQSGYIHANVSVYSPRRLVRRVTLDLKRVKESAYLDEVLSTQFRVEPDKYIAAILNSADGAEFDAGKTTKEVIFCGMPSEDVIGFQDELLARSIYPERVEIGSVAALGLLVDYLNFSKNKAPMLVLELGVETTHSFIVTGNGLESTRPIPLGLSSMIPVVQKELGLKDEESARKLFLSNAFDFTGMGPTLIRRLLKELQSSIGFYEVQTGQSIGQLLCTQLPPKLGWIEEVIAGQLGVSRLRLDLIPWLQSHRITLSESAASVVTDPRWMSVFSLMVHYHAAVPEKKE